MSSAAHCGRHEVYRCSECEAKYKGTDYYARGDKEVTDHQPTEQDKVAADYWTTRAKVGPEEANKQFQVLHSPRHDWADCAISPDFLGDSRYRRKPSTVTLSYQGREWELPVLLGTCCLTGDACGVVSRHRDKDNALVWLAALRELANGEGGQ